MHVCLRSAVALLVVCASAGALAAQDGKAPAIDAAPLYKQRCAMCHGETGDVRVENQNFADGKWRHGSTVARVASVIRDGLPGTTMAPFKGRLSEAELTALAHYVLGFDPKLRRPRK